MQIFSYSCTGRGGRRFVYAGFLVLLGAYITRVAAFKPTWPQFPSFLSKKQLIRTEPEPVLKAFKRPVLTVKDPRTQSTIHLVGVSHGSPSSANLVKDIFDEVNPDAVVVELCDDRFLSISLDANIRPRGNISYERWFDEKVEILAQREKEYQLEAASSSASYANFGLFAVFSQVTSVFRFAKSQGLFGGLFVLLGLFVSSMQRLSRSSVIGDEFVTAMREAEKINIPVRLGDAPQNDTLNSIKNVISPEVFKPKNIVSGAKLLSFSSLGFPADSSFPELSSKIPESVLKSSGWLSIPDAYLENRQMMKSLAPLLAIILATSSIGLVSFDDSSTANAANLAALEDPAAFAAAVANGPASWISLLFSLFTTELPPWVESSISTAIDAMALLVLIRMTKVIGTDRDCIIAKKVQEVSDEFPGKQIVVVIGMLHCNGVARWLISGEDPLEFTAAVEGRAGQPQPSSSST